MTDWKDLEAKCKACHYCSLRDTCTQVVFGVGDPNAEVLFIGEAPGAKEDELGQPFVGRAGKLLDDMLAMIGLSRDVIYITNSVKCRPPENRDPLPAEKEACAPWLRGQLDRMKPKIIVCLGRISAAEIIHEDFKISEEHGKFYERNGVQYMALYHPAALLRSPGKKPETFEDLKALQAKIQEVCTHTPLSY